MLGETTFIPKFWRRRGGSEKKWVLGGLKRVPATDICLGGLTMFLVKKDLEYGYEGQIFNDHPWPVLAKQLINV